MDIDNITLDVTMKLAQSTDGSTDEAHHTT
jgi:hypothetical protein